MMTSPINTSATVGQGNSTTNAHNQPQLDIWEAFEAVVGCSCGIHFSYVPHVCEDNVMAVQGAKRIGVTVARGLVAAC